MAKFSRGALRTKSNRTTDRPETGKTSHSIAGQSWFQAAETRSVIDAVGADEMRFVGGIVRDSLLGRDRKDVDIATRLPPETVIQRLEAAGLKAVPTGVKHGTVTGIANHIPFEITTLREDVETFGRHAKVAFTDDWKVDAGRRDFSMNALYADCAGAVYDYWNGIRDLEQGRVRFIGNAARRIEEDALRILRFYRFHAYYGRGEPDEAGAQACRAKAALLDYLSIERVRDELLKLLAAENPVPALSEMHDAGILGHVLPEVKERPRLERLEQLVGVEQALRRPSALRRLSVLAGLENGKSAVALGRRLRLSKSDINRLAAMAEPLGVPDLTGSAAEFEKAAYRYGVQPLIDHIILGVRALQSQRTADVVAALNRWKRPEMPVAGDDLMTLGCPEGPALGALLAELETLWIDSGFSASRDHLIGQAKRLLQND